MLKTLLALIVITCCSFHIPQDRGPSTDSLVMKIAGNQMALYLSKIPPGHDSDYGFTEKDNLENCEIARPYRIILFNDDFYSSADLNEDLNFLEIKNEWRAPIRLTGQDRVLLTVNGNPGNLTVSEIGGAELAKELQEKSMLVDKKDVYYILRIPPLSADFFVAEHDNSFVDAKFIPLSSAIAAIPSLSKNKKTIYSLPEVQKIVKDAIKALQTKKAPSKKATPVKNKSKKIKLQD